MSKRHRKNQTRQVQKQPIPSYLVSIVIPNYGRFDLLEKCLAAIPDAFGDLSYEVILVENGSPSLSYLKMLGILVHVIVGIEMPQEHYFLS